MDLLVKNIPDQVHTDFRIFCLQHKITVREGVIELLRKAGASVRELARQK